MALKLLFLLPVCFVSFFENTYAIDESGYFVSTNPATWEDAQSDCLDTFGPTGGLVAIESDNENNQIKKYLERYASGSSYWTGGMYNNFSEEFMWLATGTQVPNGEGWLQNPWAPGQPPSSAQPETRMLIVRESQFSFEWSTAVDSEELLYICMAQTDR